MFLVTFFTILRKNHKGNMNSKFIQTGTIIAMKLSLMICIMNFLHRMMMILAILKDFKLMKHIQMPVTM